MIGSHDIEDPKIKAREKTKRQASKSLRIGPEVEEEGLSEGDDEGR